MHDRVRLIGSSESSAADQCARRRYFVSTNNLPVEDEPAVSVIVKRADGGGTQFVSGHLNDAHDVLAG